MAKSKTDEQLHRTIADCMRNIDTARRQLVAKYKSLTYSEVAELDRQIKEWSKERDHARGMLQRRGAA